MFIKKNLSNLISESSIVVCLLTEVLRGWKTTRKFLKRKLTKLDIFKISRANITNLLWQHSRQEKGLFYATVPSDKLLTPIFENFTAKRYCFLSNCSGFDNQQMRFGVELVRVIIVILTFLQGAFLELNAPWKKNRYCIWEAKVEQTNSKSVQWHLEITPKQI